jgi:serine/threonine protein kinase/Flp pilus assembly protein TadD
MSDTAPDGGSLPAIGLLTTHVNVAPDGPGPADALAGRLAEELAESWRRGEPRLAEEFLAQHPTLHANPRAALRLVYEEVCLRQEFGQELSREEMLARFPQWAGELQVLLECHRLFESAEREPLFPGAGEDWGEFQLLTELGRGAQGRVFLAAEPALAHRPVVLKLTPCTGREHLSLARLQHTGIVPLYAVRDDPARNLRTLCMPYFGGVTLARLLEALRPTPLTRRSGSHVVQVLDRAQAEAPVPLPLRGPSRLVLARMSYVEAVCWIGACLADALHFAHERGLVHLDVKPSNVLLATDGQPMLLDFHLAQPPISPGKPRPEWVGGTLAYMPREQQAAMAALNGGQPITVVVDRRSDIYSLGVLLYEALGGSVPVLPGVSPPLARLNPQVSVGLSDVIARCLGYRAGDRYQDAATLAADLRRHLSHQKLRGVRNRSWGERWSKWRRRSPHALWLLVCGLLVLGALAGAGYFWLEADRQQSATRADRLRRASLALGKGKEWLTRGHYLRAVEGFERGLKLVQGLPDARQLEDDLGAQLVQARRLRAARELHRVAELIRYLFGPEDLSPRLARPLQADCRAVWARRDQLLGATGAALPAEVAQGIRTDFLDVALIWSDLRVQLAPPGEVRSAHRQALELLNEAERLFGPSAGLERERRSHAEALGDNRLAARAARRAAELQPRTSWDYCLLGRSRLRARDWAGAAAALRRAVDLEPNSFWANYYQGMAAYHASKYAEAVNAFRVCIALKPTEAASCYFNRAQAYAALGQADEALHDYRQALRGGYDPAEVYYYMARVHWQKQGDRAAALKNLEKALQAAPDHADARNLYQHLKGLPTRPRRK